MYLYRGVQPPIKPLTSVPVMSDIDFNKMSDGEKLEYVIRVYFSTAIQNETDAQTIKENKYLAELPKSSGCSDTFSDCAMWARNGECTINPEFMAYNCKKSCETCSMNPEQLYNFTRIYNSRDSDTCVYRGSNYPDITMEYIRKYKS